MLDATDSDQSYVHTRSSIARVAALVYLYNKIIRNFVIINGNIKYIKFA